MPTAEFYFNWCRASACCCRASASLRRCRSHGRDQAGQVGDAASGFHAGRRRDRDEVNAALSRSSSRNSKAHGRARMESLACRRCWRWSRSRRVPDPGLAVLVVPAPAADRCALPGSTWPPWRWPCSPASPACTLSFDAADRSHGHLWPQVLATSVGYGVFLGVLAGAALLRRRWPKTVAAALISPSRSRPRRGPGTGPDRRNVARSGLHHHQRFTKAIFFAPKAFRAVRFGIIDVVGLDVEVHARGMRHLLRFDVQLARRCRRASGRPPGRVARIAVSDAASSAPARGSRSRHRGRRCCSR